MNQRSFGVLLAAIPLFGACATVPVGPSVMVLPGAGKPFDVFQMDDVTCRQWAAGQAGVDPDRAAFGTTVGGATIGTLLGGALGAAIGAAAGDPGIGAAVGAGSGLVLGSATGASAGARSGLSVQRRYDIAYQQCMYAKGNQIPSAAQFSTRPGGQPVTPPPPAPPATGMTPPPPPPGPPPPPPPR